MRELKYLNKYFYEYRGKIIIGVIITIIARIFALIAPNLIGESITLIEKYSLNKSILFDNLKIELLKNIIFIILSALASGLFTFMMRQTIIVASRKIEYYLKNDIFFHYQTIPL